MPSISFIGISKRYGDVDAVRDLDLACADGEMLALLGPSGCGKSTTLKMAAGIEQASAGEIYFGDRPVSRLPPGQRNIAMVFEDYALYPHLTVRGNIGFPLTLRGAGRAQRAERVAEMLDLFGLTPLADQPVRGLSGGAQQRVSIGRALVRDPDLVLFDEPLSHLDGDQKVRLRAEIKRLQKLRHVTSILVTHDQTEAIAMADRVAVMNGGVLQQVAPPQEIYERPANLFVAGFIGEPPMDLMDAAPSGTEVLAGPGWRVALDERQQSLVAGRGNAAITAGIRPEHVAVQPAGMPGDAHGVIAYREPRGDADVLTIALAAAQDPAPSIVAEIPGPSMWRAGDAVSLRLPAARLLIFDASTGLNLDACPCTRH